jgi:hypothetical protein
MERTREHLSRSETLACAATAGPTPWLPEARWTLAGRRETGPHGRWRHGGPQMLGAGSPGVASPGGVSGDGCAVAVEHLVGQPAHPSIHPSIQPSGCNGNGLRPRSSGTAASVEHVVSQLPSPRSSLPILCRRWRSAADAVSRRAEQTPLQPRTGAHAITARRSGSTVMRPHPRQQHSTGGLLASRQHRGTRSSTMRHRWQTTAIKPC